MSALRPAELRTYLRNSWRILLKEVSAFGLVGALALAIELGVFKWLAPHGALKAKFVAAVLATAFAYFGNRYLSFSHRARSGLARETSFFFGINAITLVFSELVIALFVYGFNYGHASNTVFFVNVVTIGLGTIFRFWTYKRLVFLHPDRVRVRDVDLETELAE